LVHISLGYFVSTRIDIHSINWLVSNFFYSLCRFCVPIFLMLSGILLLNKDYTYENFIKRRYTRVILPYLFWGVITVIFSLFVIAKSNLTLGFVTGIMGGTTSVYWFVWLILLIYLFIPIFNQWIKNSSMKEIEYFLLLWLIVYALGLLSIPSNELRFFSLYLGFPILGYYLANKKNKILENKFLGPVLFIFSVFIAFTVSIYQSYAADTIISSIFSYQNINTVIQAVGIFLIIKNLNNSDGKYFHKISSFLKEGIFGRITFYLSRYAFGIFLTHVMIIDIFFKIGLLNVHHRAILWIPFLTLLCLSLDLVLLFILDQIPLMKKFTGAH
jgi:surface polysaccharide O-acyltransferase-like enzyme